MRGRTLLAAFAVVTAATLVGVPIGSVAADHGTTANFTVFPESDADRKPGVDDASYMTFSTGGDPDERKGFKYLEYSVLEWNAGTLGRCGPGDSKVAGIDRDNDDPGTQVDDSVKDNIEGRPVANEDRIVIDFDDPGTIGQQPVHLNVTDQFVSHMSNCRGNPDQPGWYQLTGTINGTTWNGGHAEYTTTSHYFYICDCGSYDEAERKLGPPPSKRGQSASSPTASATRTATPQPTPTRTPPADGTPFPSPTPTSATGTAAGNDGPTPTGGTTSTGSEGATATATAGSGAATSEATATAAAWAANTPASGPGFGVGAALAALLGALLVLRWRA